MRTVPRALASLVVIPIAAAVGGDTPTIPEPNTTPAARLSTSGSDGIVLSSSGGGHYLLNAFNVPFAYTAKRQADGTSRANSMNPWWLTAKRSRFAVTSAAWRWIR